MNSETDKVSMYRNYVKGCAATSIQARFRGYITREWFHGGWGDSDDSDDEDSQITTADLLRLTAGRVLFSPPPKMRNPNGGGMSSGCASPGMWVNLESGVPRKVTECPCCSSLDLVIRGFSRGGVGDDDNVYCGECGVYLGTEI